MNQIIIGKRIKVGAAVQGTLNAIVWVLNNYVLEIPIDGATALGIGNAITFPLQLWIVNQFGVTNAPKS